MNNKTTIIFIAAIVLILGAIIAIFYEFKNVPDLDWRLDYRYESKEAYGSWMFRELLREKYGIEKIYRNSIDTSFTDIVDSNNLYIIINKSYIDPEKQKDLRSFVDQGNDLLIIGKANLNHIDTICEKPRRTDYTEKERDTILNFAFLDEPDEIFQYKNYSLSLDQPTAQNYRFPDFYNSIPDSMQMQFSPLIESKNEEKGQILVQWNFEKGNVYQHQTPELFANISSKQEYYLTHFNKIFASLNPTRIILDHSSYEPFGLRQSRDRKSPLEFFLAEASLKWAYYTMLFAFLCYILFRGKRKQKAIPLLEQNENTTLSYVETLSELYLSQNQNRKLVPHFEEIFLHHVQSKYFLQPSKENFVHLLSRKSKVAEKDIDQIMKGFKNQKDGFEFTDEQLASLHQKIENFYKNAE